MTIGSTWLGRKTFHEMVCPATWVSHPGVIRSAPSTNPRYQSGCAPAVTLAGS